MTPASFPQANRNLTAPEGMTREECGDLPTFTDGQRCISLWRLSWRERLCVLFTGRVWLWVWSGHTQPPVSLATKSPFVPRGDRWRRFWDARPIVPDPPPPPRDIKSQPSASGPVCPVHGTPTVDSKGRPNIHGLGACLAAILALLLAACGGNPRPRPPAPPAPSPTPEPTITLCHLEPQSGGWPWQSLDVTPAEAEAHAKHRGDHPGSCTGAETPPKASPSPPPEEPKPSPTPPPKPGERIVICHVERAEAGDRVQIQFTLTPERADWHREHHDRDYRGACREHGQ